VEEFLKAFRDGKSGKWSTRNFSKADQISWSADFPEKKDFFFSHVFVLAFSRSLRRTDLENAIRDVLLHPKQPLSVEHHFRYPIPRTVKFFLSKFPCWLVPIPGHRSGSNRNSDPSDRMINRNLWADLGVLSRRIFTTAGTRIFAISISVHSFALKRFVSFHEIGLFLSNLTTFFNLFFV
jgi:hypothetical protein